MQIQIKTNDRMSIRKPYVIFLGDADEPVLAKTAFGVRDWARQDCLAQWRLPECKVDLGLPDMNPATAAAAGARSLLIGIAPGGGRIPPAWVPGLRSAIEAGLDVVSGLHTRLEDVEGLAALATRHNVQLINVRTPPKNLPVGNGIKRSGKRLLTVGTDCALGKKYTALTIAKALQARGVAADFRATGQTGILIAGEGVPLDCVVADFVSGAIEQLTPAAADDHWDVIEGQGSLFHPSFAGVSTGLLHGAQPAALVLCHDPVRAHMRGLPHYPVPGLKETLEANLSVARLTSPDVQAVGVALNTSKLSRAEAKRLCAETADALGLPCTDPFAMGVDPIIDRINECFEPSPRVATLSN